MPDARSKRKSPKKGANAPPTEHWKDEPDDHDFPAAKDYLTLLASERVASGLVRQLEASTLETRKAKDLLRSSRLALLPVDNAHVAADLAKVDGGDRLSPILLVRGDLQKDLPLVVADGYHRICASYHIDENADIPCRIVDLPAD